MKKRDTSQRKTQNESSIASIKLAKFVLQNIKNGKLRYKTTAKTVYDQPGSTLDQKDRDQSKL